MTTPRLQRRADRGSATAETVIVVPLAFVMLLGAVQFGVWAHASHTAHAAATAGLQVARADTGTAESAHQEAAGLLDDLGGNSLLQDPAITVARDGTQATVRVEGTAATVVPGLRLPVRAQVTGPVDRFTTGG